ncbi:MAG: SDR family oxidoreductase [Actinomycetota bacterium]|nr:SDR family oxidoreductase [Actinomycetota bacterium]
MDYGISGRVAIVSGGSRGIGRAIAAALASEGAKVVIASRTQANLDETLAELEELAPGNVHAISASMTDPASIERVVAESRDRFGPISIAISNVIGHVIDAKKEGSGPGAGTFESMSTDGYREEFGQLLISSWALARACVPDMRQAGWGRICNISSGVAREPSTFLPHLLPNVVRPSTAGMHRLFAARLAPDGITVNNILTGSILTERNRSYWVWLARERGITVAEATQDMTDRIPIGRFGEPSEIADLVAFLCSDRAGMVTGQSIPVGGGGSAHL